MLGGGGGQSSRNRKLQGSRKFGLPSTCGWDNVNGCSRMVISRTRHPLTATRSYSRNLNACLSNLHFQAHCHARYVLTRVVMEPNDGFVKITETTGADGKPDLSFTLDKSMIDSSGKVSVEKFLHKLQVGHGFVVEKHECLQMCICSE